MRRASRRDKRKKMEEEECIYLADGEERGYKRRVEGMIWRGNGVDIEEEIKIGE
jgi:hypothetical protein